MGFKFNLNGHGFGINAHLAVNPTPHRRFKGRKQRGRDLSLSNF
jgi:hypothetical protein